MTDYQPEHDDHEAILPQRLSPSRASDYQQCPRLFYYKTICKIPTPPTIHTIRGNLAHFAFERIFDFPAGSRTAELALPFVDVAWQEMLTPNLDDMDEASREQAVRASEFAHQIAPPGSALEEELLESTRTVVRNWFAMEKVNNFTPTELVMPDGTVLDGRELHVAAEISGVNLHGFIDRLDRWEDSLGKVHWSISDYKGLALDTPLATPTGWTTMGDVRVGDVLFGRDGQPTRVVGKSLVKYLPCYKLTFDDSSSIVCDEEHLWEMSVNSQTGVTTVLIDAGNLHRFFDASAASGETLWINNTSPLVLNTAVLPRDPYDFGVEVSLASRNFPGRLQHQDAAPYLRASTGQRQAFLEGILDTLAAHDPSSKVVSFSTLDEVLAQTVLELANTLGVPVTVAADRLSEDLTYRVSVALPEKLEPTERLRNLVSIEPVASVPTQCVEVDSLDSLYLAGRQMVPTHNTGKLPNPRYMDKYWIQLRVYALIVSQVYGITPDVLRLVFVASGDREKGIFKENVTDATMRSTAKYMRDLWSRITKSARTRTWDPKTGPLCNWCFFQEVCPAHQPGTDGLDFDE